MMLFFGFQVRLLILLLLTIYNIIISINMCSQSLPESEEYGLLI